MLNSGIRIQRLEKILFIIQPMTALNLTLLPLSWAMMTLRCRQRNGFIMNKNVSWPFLLNHKCNYQLGKSLITNKMETHHCVLCIGVYSKYLSPPLFFFWSHQQHAEVTGPGTEPAPLQWPQLQQAEPHRNFLFPF